MLWANIKHVNTNSICDGLTSVWQCGAVCSSWGSARQPHTYTRKRNRDVSLTRSNKNGDCNRVVRGDLMRHLDKPELWWNNQWGIFLQLKIREAYLNYAVTAPLIKCRNPWGTLLKQAAVRRCQSTLIFPDLLANIILCSFLQGYSQMHSDDNT